MVPVAEAETARTDDSAAAARDLAGPADAADFGVDQSRRRHPVRLSLSLRADTKLRTDTNLGPELEHRDIDRHGPGWDGVRDGIADDAGWPLYLTRYAALFGEGN